MTDRVASVPSRIHRVAWFLVLAVFIVRMLPAISSRYMQLDGVTYATIARNMSVGIGDFWHPVYTDFWHPVYAAAEPGTVFHEHPPLAFGIESLLFRMLGDHYWVEKLYSVLTTLGTGWAMWVAWRLLLRDYPEARACSWLPVVAWILMPCWTRATVHNLLENTLGLFCAWSVVGVLRAMESCRWKMIAWSSVTGMLVAAALLSKGPVALFPLLAPLFAFFTLRRRSLGTAIVVTLLIAVAAALTLGAALRPPEAREFVAVYWRQQVLASLQGNREMVDSPLGRLSILWKLVAEMAGPFAVACGIVCYTRRKRPNEADQRLARVARFFLLVAASASLPLALSPKQHGWYLFTSCPYYALALAGWCLPGLLSLLRDGVAMQAGPIIRRFLVGTAACSIGAVVAWRIVSGGLSSDCDLLDAVDRFGKVVPPHSFLHAPSDMDMQARWMLQADLYRRDYITLVWDDKPCSYQLAALGEVAVPAGYVPANVDFMGHRLLVATPASDGLADRRSADQTLLH